MADIIGDAFRSWTAGKTQPAARVAVFERIRDIPYAVTPEISSSQRYAEILSRGCGSCTPKHFLLCDMYRRLGVEVLYVVYPFRWYEVEIDYPPRLRRLARSLPLSHHLACLADIGGRLTLVDATLDLALKKLGLPVNESWDGISDTTLPVKPCGEAEIYHHLEASLMQPQNDPRALAFYAVLNSWLAEARQSR